MTDEEYELRHRRRSREQALRWAAEYALQYPHVLNGETPAEYLARVREGWADD